jgi:formylglycine-generating enzyme required for sulfatase activity
MALPSPLPDNPLRWEGWRNYGSPNLYERLCLDPETAPTAEEIEDNCRRLLVWWQKKLPLKNQPSNPMAQLLRSGIDEAPGRLAEARAALLDGERRSALDLELRVKKREAALAELHKYFDFAAADGWFSDEDEVGLLRMGQTKGLTEIEVREVIASEIVRRGLQRKLQPPPPPPARPSEPARGSAGAGSGDPAEEFRRVLRMTRLDDGEMTDDQRDALCNIGEGFGLSGGEAEDLIDEYLDEMNLGGVPAPAPARLQPAPPRPSAVPRPAASGGGVAAMARGDALLERVAYSPVQREMEVRQYPPFLSVTGAELVLVPTGLFSMGSNDTEGGPGEVPTSAVGVGCFYLSRHPVTNVQYERFDPAHRSRRPAWAGDDHPVVLVTSLEAIRFCEWLSGRERKRYRLPTEAEWEFAAKGMEGRRYPWGGELNAGDLANFADARTKFTWRDPVIDDGWAETSPVGYYPKGASPFGLLDMAGNVWEWCLDFYAPYTARSKANPTGGPRGTQRVYRGGSWKSKPSNLRCAARGYNSPTYSANDVGFRIVCICGDGT